MKAGKTWREKLVDSKDLPKVERIPQRMQKRWGTGTIAIPAPIEVDQIMKRIPRGKLATIDLIRRIIARRHRATIGCPMTTGIFAWIAAHAADEAEREGKKRITPYWRTLKSGGQLNEKYPGGIASLKTRLESEGHTVVRKGTRFFVTDFEKSFFNLSL